MGKLGENRLNNKMEFNPNNKEYQKNTDTLVPIGGKLPYYVEVRTSKVLDILSALYQHKLPKNRYKLLSQ